MTSPPVPPADLLHAAAFQLRNPLHLPGLRAAIDPDVAVPLADWLEAAGRQEAYTLAEFGHRGGAGPHAVAVARAVLGNGDPT